MDEEFKWLTVSFAVGIPALLGIIVLASYLGTQQRLECMTLNAHRPSADVINMCGPIGI